MSHMRVAGWWHSTISNAGNSLVLMIDWLARQSDAPEVKINRLKPPTEMEEAVFGLLMALPEGKGLSGKEIRTALKNRRPPIILSQSALTSRVIPNLRERGVHNRKGIGYYIKR